MAGKPWGRKAADAWTYGIECPPWVPRVLGAVFVICLVAFLAGMSEAGERSEQIIAHSLPTEGKVLDFSEQEARELRRGLVRFQIDGTVREAEVVIADRKVKRGDTVGLRYDPDDPLVVFAEGDRQPPGAEIPVWVGIAFATTAVAGIGAVFALRPRRTPKQIGE